MAIKSSVLSSVISSQVSQIEKPVTPDWPVEQEENKYEGGEQSQHMVARWYRPPEIILDSGVYDFKIDIWSLGCIFAELMYTWLPG